MTIKEALTATVNFPLPEVVIEKALIDSGLDGTVAYELGDAKAVDICMSELLLVLATSPDVSEDDASIKLPSRDVLLKLRTELLGKWNIGNPTVRRVNAW